MADLDDDKANPQTMPDIPGDDAGRDAHEGHEQSDRLPKGPQSTGEDASE